MRFQTFSDQPQPTYPVAILVPQLDQAGMQREYLDPHLLDRDSVIAYELHQTGKKTSASTQREFLNDLLPFLEDLDVQYLVVGNADYFKTLAGVGQAEPYLGYVLPSAFPADQKGRFQVIYAPNFRQVFHNPGPTKAKIAQAFDALWNHQHNLYRDPGCNIIAFSAYPSTVTDIAQWLHKLLNMDCPLAIDIEGFSLKHHSAGIGIISFAWSKHEGIAFAVDLGENPKEVRKLLAQFFRNFTQKALWHNISYDVYVLIYQLFMEHLIDTEGLLEGLEIMLRNWDDTKLITYLATNSCAGNELGLKVQSQEFSGNYAVDEITDITKIPLPQLLEYNLIDALSTWFVYEKHWDTLVADDQLEIYEELFKPAIWDIIQMQLTGMPLDMDKVAEAKKVLEIDCAKAVRTIQSHSMVRHFTHTLDLEHVVERNAALKKKQIQLGDEPQEFNPNSGPQMQRLLYEVAELPVIERTPTKQPATGADVLEKLKAYTEDPTVKELLDAFVDHAKVEKILTAFIPHMEAAILAPDGCHYLFGNFNLGGTLSGRLSSSKPNLQTIPANSHYAKPIKDCFRAPDGWLFVGLDFASLEDRISALTTKDPNKLKVYQDGFDGHSLRAHSYFAERMPDIEVSPEGARCFKAKVGSSYVYFHEEEEVEYLGQPMKGSELYELLARQAA